jgi:hypothetical protein
VSESPAGDRLRGVVCEWRSVSRLKAENEWWSMRNSGREVEKSGNARSLMAMVMRGELKKRATRLRQKQDKEKHTKENRINP